MARQDLRTTRVNRRQTVAGALGLILPVTPASSQDLKGQPPLPSVLRTYRDESLASLDGAPTTLGALLGPQRPTVVSFWATWCAPCLLEGRRLSSLRSNVPDARLTIIGINVEHSADPARLAAFRQRAKMNYLQATRGGAVYAAMTGSSKMVLPRVYVFDAHGTPVAAFGRFFGNRSLDAVETAVRAVIG